MGVGTSRGMPGTALLLFTILVWALFLLVYLSNRRNKSNQWCAFAGFCFSMGVFKEYLYFSLDPSLTADLSFYSPELSYHIYSVLTGVLYYLAMPCSIMFSFYFSNFDQRHPKSFRLLRFITFVPAVIFSVVYPIADTRFYQLNDRTYYLLAAIYNWCCGIFMTFLLLSTLVRERLQANYRQRKMAAVVVLTPLWYWLFSAFAIHLLGLRGLFKVWQGNIFIIFLLLLYYVKNLFEDGILGTRLKRETYDWTASEAVIQKNAQYVGHALKNELSKIQWCLRIMQQKHPEGIREELDILSRSVSHLTNFVNKTKIYSDRISLDLKETPVRPLLEQSIQNIPTDMRKGIRFSVSCPRDLYLLCDSSHVLEVMNNLLNNAIEASASKGEVKLTCVEQAGRRQTVISVEDKGCGIPKEELPYLFEPYHTTKTTNHHLGIGIYYCTKVMKEHHGAIKVKSIPGKGTIFFLYFPLKYRLVRQKKGLSHEN